MSTTYIVDVTPENADTYGFYCIKNLKEQAHKNKKVWYDKRFKEGLRIKILYGEDDKAIGFIEYVPAEFAWRPVKAQGYMFIHCMYIYPNKNKNQGHGSLLLKACEEEAKKNGLAGVCTMTSKGTWLADKQLFEKNGYEQVDQLDRFDLMAKAWNGSTKPELLDFTGNQGKYKGWHILYADQCPWKEKSVQAMLEIAHENGFEINVHKIKSAKEAQKGPSGFGVFALLKDGKLLEDHYISGTRFKNILKKELI